jgi:hypothetical protein
MASKRSAPPRDRGSGRVGSGIRDRDAGTESPRGRGLWRRRQCKRMMIGSNRSVYPIPIPQPYLFPQATAPGSRIPSDMARTDRGRIVAPPALSGRAAISRAAGRGGEDRCVSVPCPQLLRCARPACLPRAKQAVVGGRAAAGAGGSSLLATCIRDPLEWAGGGCHRIASWHDGDRCYPPRSQVVARQLPAVRGGARAVPAARTRHAVSGAAGRIFPPGPGPWHLPAVWLSTGGVGEHPAAACGAGPLLGFTHRCLP